MAPLNAEDIAALKLAIQQGDEALRVWCRLHTMVIVERDALVRLLDGATRAALDAAKPAIAA